LSEARFGRTQFGGDYDPETAAGDRLFGLADLIATAWSQVLERNAVQFDDAFVEIGGDSIAALRVASSLYSSVGIELDASDFVDYPTPLQLAELVLRRIEQGSAMSSAAALGPSNPAGPDSIATTSREGDRAPLSHSQEALWAYQHHHPQAWLFNMPLVLMLEGRLDIHALDAAFQNALQSYSALRTCFGQGDDGAPYQSIAPTSGFAVAVEDATDASTAAVDALLDRDERTPFDLARAPLLRVRVLKLAETRYLLSTTIHHIIFDGWSYRVLFREVAAAYNAHRRGSPKPVALPGVQLADYARWQRTDADLSRLMRDQREYWSTQLRGLQKREWRRSARGAPTAPDNGVFASMPLDAEVTRRLRAVAARYKTSLVACLLSIYDVLLAARTHTLDVAVGTIVANRRSPALADAVGFFVNAVVLRSDLSGNPTFGELARRNWSVIRSALDHQELPFGETIALAENPGEYRDNPYYQALFVFLPWRFNEHLALDGITVRKHRQGYSIARGDLVLELEEASEGLVGGFYFDRDYFEPAAIERLITDFGALLRRFLDNPELPVSGELQMI